MAYAATLGVILIATILGLAFIAMVGTHTAVSEGRNEAMQSQYLAETAVHHALWRFANEPGFPADETVYYMHDLAGGRYGYKMRRPTPTTFAAVATVGVVDDHVARQSYVPYVRPKDLLLSYGRKNDTSPEYRRMFGTNWSDSGNTVEIYSEPVWWMELEGSPIGREAVMGVLDDNSDIHLAVWDGSSWGSERAFSTGTNRNYKVFDLAYESQTGGALVVGRYDASGRAQYNYWDGLDWEYTTSQLAFYHDGAVLANVVLDPNPKSDGILIGSICSDYNLDLHYWTGAGFVDLGQFDNDVNTYGHGCLDIVHEQQSGDAMVVWTHFKRPAVVYAALSGIATLDIGLAPGFGSDDIRLVRVAADPASDYILMAAVLNNNELHAAAWDGDSWTDSALIESKVTHNDRHLFDVAWEAAGGQAMLAWGPDADKTVPHYITWQPETALADCVPQSAPDCLTDVKLMRLSPVSGSDDLLLVTRNNDQELRYSHWTGSSFHGTEASFVDSPIDKDQSLSFDLAEAMVTRVVGEPKNSAPVVNAGNDQTILASALAPLLGEVSDDGLPDPPASVSTTWSKVSGPGVVVFQDPSALDTRASFSRGGEYVLRLTADDGELTGYDELTVSVELYVEAFESWSIKYDAAWTAVDLSGEPFNVPADAVLEIAIANSDAGAQWYGGVRAVGSTLERKLRAHEAESGGTDVLVMHVQADATSTIECYVEDKTQIEFTLLGYWAVGTFVEDWTYFQASASWSWRDHALATYGVGAGQVAEIMIANTSTTAYVITSLRTDGSTLNTRAPYLHEAEDGEHDAVTMFVTAGNDNNATVEVWTSSSTSVRFFLTGYWSDPPGTYVQAGEDLGDAFANSTWETLDLSIYGVPAHAVAQLGLVNRSADAENHFGVRRVGSALQRTLNLHEAEGGGEDLGTMHVQTGTAASIERYHQDVSDAHIFELYGWWE